VIVRRDTRSGRRRRGPGGWVVIRDLGTFVLSWGIIYLQALSDREPSWGLLLLVGALLGVPGAAEIWRRVAGDESGSGSPSSSSPPSSSTSSSG